MNATSNWREGAVLPLTGAQAAAPLPNHVVCIDFVGRREMWNVASGLLLSTTPQGVWQEIPPAMEFQDQSGKTSLVPAAILRDDAHSNLLDRTADGWTRSLSRTGATLQRVGMSRRTRDDGSLDLVFEPREYRIGKPEDPGPLMGAGFSSDGRCFVLVCQHRVLTAVR